MRLPAEHGTRHGRIIIAREGLDTTHTADSPVVRTWEAFLGSWNRMLGVQRRRVVGGLFGGLLGVAVLSAVTALALAAFATTGPWPGDAWVSSWVEGLLSPRRAVFLSAFGSAAMLVPLALCTAGLAAMAGRGDRALAVVLTLLGCKVITLTMWMLWERPRPEGIGAGLIQPASPSFPSGHVVQAVAVYGLLGAWWSASTSRTWEKVLAWSTVIAVVAGTILCRIRLGAHRPSDCWASAALGLVWLAVVLMALSGRAHPVDPQDSRP